MDIIPVISSNILSKETNSPNGLLILDAYSKILKLHIMENITNEELMDKLYMFQAKSGKVDEFFWWDMERIQTENGTQFT